MFPIADGARRCNDDRSPLSGEGWWVIGTGPFIAFDGEAAMGLKALFKIGPSEDGSTKPRNPTECVRLEWEQGEMGTRRQDAGVDLREEWGLTVVAPEAIERRKIVRVRESGSLYYAEVISLASVRGGFEIELAFLDNGRRREPRVSALGVAWLEASATPGAQPNRASVVNVSASGIGLLCERPWTKGETLRVRGEGTEKLGRVRYCIEVAGCYQVGLQFCEAPDESA